MVFRHMYVKSSISFKTIRTEIAVSSHQEFGQRSLLTQHMLQLVCHFQQHLQLQLSCRPLLGKIMDQYAQLNSCKSIQAASVCCYTSTSDMVWAWNNYNFQQLHFKWCTAEDTKSVGMYPINFWWPTEGANFTISLLEMLWQSTAK